MESMTEAIPAIAKASVLAASEDLPEDATVIRGYDFNSSESVDYDKLFASYFSTGFQASNFAEAISIVQEMLDWKPSQKQIDDDMSPDAKCRIFLGYTSNMVSSGVRETIRFLAQHKLVDVIVTTTGGIEEDLIKCLGDTVLGSFSLEGEMLHKRRFNRIGNLIIPNANYCRFEDWLLPILDEAHEIQTKEQMIFSPSTLIKLMGERIAHEDSILYWAAKNDIPVFCPALTDGAIGDLLFFHSYKKPGLVVDLVRDIRRINKLAITAPASGMIILGGGVVKHHIANANLMRNGADYSVYINTGQEFDGSDAGASPDEAVSWGKIKFNARRTKVCADATLVFPLLVAQTFAKRRKR